MTKDQDTLRDEIKELEAQLSLKKQKLNKISTHHTPKIGLEVETKSQVKGVNQKDSTFEQSVQELFLAFEKNRLKRDNFRTYMYFFSFPVVLLFLAACCYMIYKNPDDKSLLGIAAAALTALLTLLGYSSYKKNKE